MSRRTPRCPSSLAEAFNRRSRRSSFDLRNAMYVEGGPEAQLYVAAGGLRLELVGSFETGFYETDDNLEAWPVPNVVGVVRRSR